MPETSQVLRRPSVLGRIVDSIRSRGLKPTFRIIRGYKDDAMFDFRYGVNTCRPVDLKDIEVVGDNRDQGVKYQPIKSRVFRSAINKFRIPPDGVFVDYGSGKGRILLLAVLYGFQQTVGVEFAKDLFSTAEHNVQPFRDRTGMQFDARILNQDAACYQVNDDDCVLFLYNPFQRDVLEQVLNKIRLSLHSKPRSIFTLSMRIPSTATFWMTTHFGARPVKLTPATWRSSSIPTALKQPERCGSDLYPERHGRRR